MIEGKIIRIVGESEFIINVGIEAGVKPGMRFIVYEMGEHIIDPETGEDLGAIENVKGRLEVKHAQDKMSRAVTGTYVVDNQSPLYSGLFTTTSVTKKYHLEVDTSQVQPLDEVLQIRIGDLVRSVGN